MNEVTFRSGAAVQRCRDAEMQCVGQVAQRIAHSPRALPTEVAS